MSHDLLFGLPIPVGLALLALVLILLALARALLALRKPALVHVPTPAPVRCDEAPYKIEAQALLLAGRLDVVPHAGREPANR